MSDIELVIKIPQDAYELMRKRNDLTIAERVIANGKPLPKGHGKLKDIDKIINDGISKGFCEWYDEMKYAETIIEADKESET